MTDDTSGDCHLTDLTLPALEERLTCLAARIAAAECDFLLTLAEFDAREGWGVSGLKSTAHWLSWRTGMRLGVARDRVRVARTLSRLPLITEAFAAGRLSFCKVRALSRVTTPPTESSLLELALGCTGAQLETLVKAWRRTLINEMSASRHLRRGVRRREEDDGAVTYTIRLAPEDAGVLDAALAAGRRIALDGDGAPVETPEESRLAEMVTGDPPLTRVDADVVVMIAESFLTSETVAIPGEAGLVVIHADLDALAVPHDVGDADSVDVEPATEPDSVVVTAPRDARTGDHAGMGDRSAEQVSRATRPPTCKTSDGTPLSRSTILRLLCRSPVQLMVHARDGRPLDLGRTRRHASARQRRALLERDGRCRFPGCSQRHRLIPHHTVWWTLGGRTDLDLLILLCPTHHRAVHDVGYGVRALGAGRFGFTRPDGTALESVGVMVASAAADPPQLREVGSIIPTWGGERIDLHHVIGGLADNLLVDSGVDPMTLSLEETDEALRRAAQWPLGTRAA